MNNYATAPTAVPRSVFLDGHAECHTCRAHVRPTAASRDWIRLSGTDSATAWCRVCGTRSDYKLAPRRMKEAV